MIVIYTDGLAEPRNPGIATYGYVIYRDNDLLKSGHGFAGDPATNNYAEYAGLVAALRAIAELRDEEVIVRADSKLLVNQMAGEWSVSKKASRGAEGSYYEKFLEARSLANRFTRIRFEWIPREQNLQADELSRVAYRERLARHAR